LPIACKRHAIGKTGGVDFPALYFSFGSVAHWRA
jgi:hypothetical protein